MKVARTGSILDIVGQGQGQRHFGSSFYQIEVILQNAVEDYIFKQSLYIPVLENARKYLLGSKHNY